MNRRFRFTPGRLCMLMVATAWLIVMVPGCSDTTVEPPSKNNTVPGTVTLKGQAFDLKVLGKDWKNASIVIRETMKPYRPVGEWDNLMPVMEVTTAKIIMAYRTTAGQEIKRMAEVQIDNVTRQIYYEGAQITRYAQLFSSSQNDNIADTVSFCVYSDYPVTMETSPAVTGFVVENAIRFHNVEPAAVTRIPKAPAKLDTTDSGRVIGTSNDGYPPCPDLDSATECQELMDMGLKDSVTKVGEPTDTTNCWGWTFTCGKKWINDSADVRKILEDNGYTEVNDPQPGDVVVYKDSNGAITHTGIVRAAPGGGIKIESKWGRMGRYCHSPTAVPPSYGTPCYFRTNRPAPPGSMDPDKEKHTLK